MEDLTIYEIILKTQCDSYNQILYILDRISRVDDGLIIEVNKDTPNVQKIKDFTNHKNDLINEIDFLTKRIEENQIKLVGAMSLIINAANHPLYERLNLLQEIVRHKIDHLLLNEDRANPVIYDCLLQYKDRLELDIKIAKVPKEKRQIFYYDPRK